MYIRCKSYTIYTNAVVTHTGIKHNDQRLKNI